MRHAGTQAYPTTVNSDLKNDWGHEVAAMCTRKFSTLAVAAALRPESPETVI